MAVQAFKRTNIIVLLIVSSIASSSSALEPVRDFNLVHIRDASCEKVKAFADKLVQWKRNIGERDNCHFRFVPSREPGQCEADVSDCMPILANMYHDVSPQQSGPNCWNLSLVMSNVLYGLRYSTPEEMNFYTNSPLCRPLKDDEVREPGDLVAIRKLQGDTALEDHGFIYISDEIAFSKNGYLMNNPYALQSLEGVYTAYSVPLSSQCRANTIDGKATCTKATAFYRCSPLWQFIRNHSDISAPLNEVRVRLNEFENCFERPMFRYGQLDNECKRRAESMVQSLTTYLNAQFGVSRSELARPENQFLLRGIQLRLKALSEQLSLLNETDLASQFRRAAHAVDEPSVR